MFFDPAICSVSKSKKQALYTYDLNLDVPRRGNRVKNADALAKYREAWRLLGG